VTVVLARRATTALRGRRFVAALTEIGEVVAERRQRLVASVTSAVVLTQAQTDRLGALLERAYGRAVQLNVSVDPSVLGGLRIQVGADVVDSTVLSRLADARRRLAG
jgi:F-type H+-transporting ATPase subunit delta